MVRTLCRRRRSHAIREPLTAAHLGPCDLEDSGAQIRKQLLQRHHLLSASSPFRVGVVGAALHARCRRGGRRRKHVVEDAGNCCEPSGQLDEIKRRDGCLCTKGKVVACDWILFPLESCRSGTHAPRVCVFVVQACSAAQADTSPISLIIPVNDKTKRLPSSANIPPEPSSPLPAPSSRW